MVEAIVGVVGAVLALILYLLKRRETQAQADAPEQADAARDAAVADPDPTALAVRLSQLHDKAARRRAASGSRPDGDTSGVRRDQ